MKVGLIDIDGHNYPNLALMKISAYHKSIGDQVEWVMIGQYDMTYISKVFTFSKDKDNWLSSLGKIVKGGTGYNYNVLPDYIDKLSPDYSIYPQFKDAYGFLTRGCPNRCSWRVVPMKEGIVKPYSDIEDFLNGRKSAILMDNNVLAHKHGISQIEKIVRLGIKIDFNQGLDCRIIAKDESIAELLTHVKWIRFVRMACDTSSQMPFIERAVFNLNRYNFKPYRVFVYVLVKDIEDALNRISFLKKLGVVIFAQPYRDFTKLMGPTKEQKRLARWVNHKAIFNTIEYKNYI